MVKIQSLKGQTGAMTISDFLAVFIMYSVCISLSLNSALKNPATIIMWLLLYDMRHFSQKAVEDRERERERECSRSSYIMHADATLEDPMGLLGIITWFKLDRNTRTGIVLK